jgi:hypothetical protein
MSNAATIILAILFVGSILALMIRRLVRGKKN